MVTTENEACFPHISPERERNRQLRKWGSLSAQLGEKERETGRAVVVL